MTEKKQLEKGDYLNTASLVILDSNMKTDEEELELTKFSIFEKATIKELETNPDGTKYPIAILLSMKMEHLKKLNYLIIWINITLI